MKNFSFFYTKGGSGYTLGEQVADFFGGKKNPTSGFENDICIYVKIIPPENHPKHSYLNVDDAPYAAEHLKTHPELGVIAVSKVAQDYLNNLLGRNDVVLIPHHHVNYDRWIRPKREVKVVGIIGSNTSFQYPIELFRQELAKIGLELRYDKHYWNTYKSTPDMEGRLKVVNFYKNIDIQVAYRLKAWSPRFTPYRCPNKLGNASSFGIPTVAYPEEDYVREWGDNFVHANTIEEMLASLKLLKDNPEFYQEISEKARKKSEDYHIDHVSKLYLNLK